MNTALSNDQIRKMAPSVFATEPWEQVSDAYTFIPTINLVEALREEGFVPVRASQSVTRIEGKAPFAKHMLRFRREQDMDFGKPKVVNGNAHHFYAQKDAPEIPEIVLVNSHDRSSGFRLSAGIFRLACSNGLIIKSANFGDFAVRHSGNVRDDVIEGSLRIIEEMPAVMDAMGVMKGITLAPQEQVAYATAALALRYPTGEDGKAPITAESLLGVRRVEDKGNDLWTTFNRVQENFIKGGLRGVGSTGKRMRTRAIKSVNEDVRLNKALWQLTEHMAAIKA